MSSRFWQSGSGNLTFPNAPVDSPPPLICPGEMRKLPALVRREFGDGHATAGNAQAAGLSREKAPLRPSIQSWSGYWRCFSPWLPCSRFPGLGNGIAGPRRNLAISLTEAAASRSLSQGCTPPLLACAEATGATGVRTARLLRSRGTHSQYPVGWREMCDASPRAGHAYPKLACLCGPPFFTSHPCLSTPRVFPPEKSDF
jgi:hypothetical protein